jgi:hypothetical protein
MLDDDDNDNDDNNKLLNLGLVNAPPPIPVAPRSKA